MDCHSFEEFYCSYFDFPANLIRLLSDHNYYISVDTIREITVSHRVTLMGKHKITN